MSNVHVPRDIPELQDYEPKVAIARAIHPKDIVDKRKAKEAEIEKLKEEQDAKEAKEWRKIVREWCEDTTSHGFSNIIKTNSWFIRLCWIFILFFSIGYCFYSKSKNRLHI